MPQILIVDDHPLVREAVCCTVDAVLDQSMIREAGSVNEAFLHEFGGTPIPRTAHHDHLMARHVAEPQPPIPFCLIPDP